MLTTLIAHEHWANHRIVDAMVQSGGWDDRSRVLFDHILGAHTAWLARISGADPEVGVWHAALEPSTYPARVDGYYEQWKRVLAFEDTERAVAYTNVRGARFTNTVGGILLHVSMHGQYHRGQLTQQARPRWDVAPSTDLIVFLRESGPAL